nr:unnamed protein product [Callosobruchus analis]
MTTTGTEIEAEGTTIATTTAETLMTDTGQPVTFMTDPQPLLQNQQRKVKEAKHRLTIAIILGEQFST